MKRIYLFLTTLIACILGAIVTLFFGLHPACMLGTIIIIIALVRMFDYYFRERQEEEEKLYAEIMEKDRAMNDFSKHFGIDQRRAERLYNNGFKDISDFKDKTIEELMEMDELNPTLAKRIHQKMEEM